MTADALVATFAALGEPTRWAVLSALGSGDASASALAAQMPVSRQAIAKHLAVLESVGLVEPLRSGREVRYRALGSEVSAVARELDRVGSLWES
ncbi:MAG: metalloregulator ArsR/SmtB family transcription factor, partial [Actinomycetota bacterium]